MKNVNVKFLKYHSWGSKGDIVNVSEYVAARLVSGKYAVIIPAEPTPESKAKPARKKPNNKAMSAKE